MASRSPAGASIKLGRGNYGRPSLLKTVGGKSTRRKSRHTDVDALDSSPDVLNSKQTVSRIPEPAIDDPPISSGDEESSSNNTPSSPEYTDRRDQTAQTPKKKVPQISPLKRARGTTAQQRSPAKDKLRKNSIAKGLQSFGVKGDDEDEMFTAFRAPNKGKLKQYSSRSTFANIHGEPTRNDKSRRKHQPLASSPSKTTGETIEFKVPMGFSTDDVPSSSFPTETSRGDDKVFYSDLDFDLDGSSSPLSSISSSVDYLLTAEQRSRLEFAPVAVHCPVCEQVIDDEFADRVKASEGKGFRKQEQVCVAHKKRTAERDWVERGYPTIDWEGLDGRIERHFPALKDMLLGRKPSFYRTKLESEGKRDNIRLTATSDMAALSSGYYGGKGSKQISDLIVERFWDDIGQLAPKDSVIRAAGPSGYIQTVLVPELATLLIKEDMEADDDGARQIMQESTEIGDRLNAIPNDVVPISRRRRKSFVH